MKYHKLLLSGLVILALVVVLFVTDMDEWLTLEAIRSHLDAFHVWSEQSPWLVMGIFFLLYLATAILALPGATVMALLAGALFGMGWGLLVASFASSISAALAFLLSRTLLRQYIERRCHKPLKAVNEGLDRDGLFYLLSLRLVPIFPFFMVNLVMGLTRLKLLTFYSVSQLGMLPGTVVYVNAGKQLSGLESFADILSPELLFSLVMLGLFPLLGKKTVDVLRSHRKRRPLQRPRSHE